MNSQLLCLSRSLREFPRYSRRVQDLAALAFCLRATFRTNLARRLEDLTRGFSLAQSTSAIRFLARSLRPYLPDDEGGGDPDSTWEANEVGWDFFRGKIAQSPAVTRTIILKEPGENGEKGVILSCFEYNWLRILSGIKPFEDFEKRYTLVLSTSWSPTNYDILALALEKISGDVFVVPCNYGEIPKLEAFHPRIRPLPFLACDWLEPSCFSPRPWNERTYDIVMVSNWAPFKRHWHLFWILRDLPSDLRVVCIGQPEAGHTLDDIRRLKDQFAVPQEIEFLESISIEEVNEIQANSKIALILSRREGCCVAAVEGLMANAYLVMLEGAHVGPLEYISEETGAIVTGADAPRRITGILDSQKPPSSREWATEQVSCQNTRLKLNQILREAAEAEQRPWTRDLAPVYWRPFPRYLREDDRERIAPLARILSQEYPAVFAEGWLDRSHH